MLFYFIIPTSQPSQCQSYQAHSGVRANMMDVVTDLGHIKVRSASARETLPPLCQYDHVRQSR